MSRFRLAATLAYALSLSLAVAGTALAQAPAAPGAAQPKQAEPMPPPSGGAAVPSGHVADGLLVFDVPDTYRTDDTFRVTLGADGGLRVVVQSAPRFP